MAVLIKCCTKRDATQETSHIHILLASSLAKQSLTSIGSREISRYRDPRLRGKMKNRRVVFNIKGNDYRLIVAVSYKLRIV